MFDFLEQIDELFIIGNGFDLAHDLKTGYWDFRDYLEKTDEDFLYEFEKLFGYEPLNDDHYHTKESLQKMIESRNNAIYKHLWKEFELNLGNLDDQQILDFSSCIVEDLDLDSGKIGILDTLNQYWREYQKYGSFQQT